MLKFLCLLLISVNFSVENPSDDYIDPVIDMLLNGISLETQSNEDDGGDDPVLISGIWKCGNCTDVNDSNLVYSEDNEVDADVADEKVDIQIGLSLQGMRCVTVAADKPGVVRRLSGACDGTTVTLHVSPTRNFVVHVYN